VTAIIVGVWVSPCAMASNRIRQWNLNVPAYKYDIDEQNAIVTIKEGSTEIFKFEAYDDATGDPGYINVCTTGGVMTRLNGQPIFPLDLTTYAGEPIPSLASADAALHARLLTSIS